MHSDLAGLLRLLGQEPSLLVDGVRDSSGTLVVDLVFLGTHSATLIANVEAASMYRDRRGGKHYGAYQVLDVGYGDWIKGDTAEECAAYVVAWLSGRFMIPDPLGATYLDSSMGGVPRSQPDLAEIGCEIGRRSSLRTSTTRILTSLNGELSVSLDLDGELVVGLAADRHFVVRAPSDELRSAAILGFLDGCSTDSDE